MSKSKKIGILLMAASALSTFFMILMIAWNPEVGFFAHLSLGYIYAYDCKFESWGKTCEFYLYFKYVAVVPAIIALYGLYKYLEFNKETS